MNVCPHCKADPCLPLWRKLLLGPMSSAQCQVCGYRVGVDVTRAWIAMLPSLLVVGMAVAGVLRDPTVLAPAALICLAATAILYIAWVPLLPDELTNASMVEAGRARIAAEKHAANTQRADAP
jgi:hypothetical protein